MLFGTRCTLQKLTMESPVMQRLASRRSASYENQVLPLRRSSVSGATEITIAERPDL